MMKKKLLTLVLAVALCLGVVPSLTACGGKGDITVMLLSNSAEDNFYRAHFDSVEESLGIEIEYVPLASADYYDNLSIQINAGKTPDIFYIRQSDVRQFIHDGIVADISEYLGDYSSTLDKVYSSAKDIYKYDESSKTWGTGGTYAIPKDLSVQQLGYNKNLIYRNRQHIYNEFKDDTEIPRNADNTVKLPWEMDWSKENYTWDQYLRMAKALQQNGKTEDGKSIYGSDIPKYEVLMWSFGGRLISEDMQTVNITSEAFQKAVKFQADLIDEGAANYAGATYTNFTGDQNVCFYGEVNSFDIQNFDNSFGKDNWGVMPWPVEDASTVEKATSWNGIITSAGYAVSKSCKNKELAVQIIMSLLADDVQNRLVQTEKLMLPLFESVAEEYVKSDYDDIYSPKSRQVYIDVISGKNGRISDTYKCYELTWTDHIQTNYLDKIFASEKGSANSKLITGDALTTFAAEVQNAYNERKDY